MKRLFEFVGMIVGLVGGIGILPVYADTTYVSGTISTNTVWDTTGSPYIVIGDVVVNGAVSLTIQPGVEVKFDGVYNIMIKGTLNAIGTATDSIIITKIGTAGWNRLWFKTGSYGSLKYCRIECASNSAIYNEKAMSLYVGYCTISNNSGSGIYTSYECSSTITNNTISNNSAANGGGIYNGNGCSATIRYNTITDTTSSAIYLYSNSNALIRTNNLYATGYVVYNTSANNIDARYNWWNTTDTAEINNLRIWDFYDDSTKGIVYYKPFLDTAFSDTIAPSAPTDLTANGSNPSPWTNDSLFVINWTNPADPSGISEYYYRLGSSPTSDFDISGTFRFPSDTVTATDPSGWGQKLYLWLVDSSGNLNYQNNARILLLYDRTPPVIENTTIWKDTADFWGPFEIKTHITEVGVSYNPVMFYRTSADTNWIADTMVSIGEHWYIDSIPAQTPQDSIRIDYYLTVEDYATNSSRDPSSGSYSFVVRLVGIEEHEKTPDKFVLFSPTPNPSMNGSIIKYGLPEKASVSLRLYDISGRLVRTIYSGVQDKGYYEVKILNQVQNDRLNAGVYFIRLEAADFTPSHLRWAGFTATRKLTILK